MMETPLARSSLMTAKRAAVSSLVRLEVGSSMMSTRASVEIALAISTIC